MNDRCVSERTLVMQQAPEHRTDSGIERRDARKAKRRAAASKVDVKAPCFTQGFALIRRWRQRGAQARDQLVVPLLVPRDAGKRLRSGGIVIY